MIQTVALTILLASLVSTGEAELVNTLCPIQGSWLNVYNLITITDMDGNSDVEGSAFIGGDIVSRSSANFAIHLNEIPATDVSLEVAGSFGSGNALQLSHGSGRVTDGNVNKRNNVQWQVHGRTCNVNSGNQGANFALDPTLPAKANQIKEDLQEWSADLAALAPNNSYQAPGSQPGAFKFIVSQVDANGVAIFNVPRNKLFNNNKVQQIEFVGLNKASAILINVAGTDLELRKNFVGSAPSDSFRKKVIWNLYEAETFYAETMFNGALLAPYCVLNNRNTMDGSVAVLYLKAQSEIHLPMLDIGCDDAEYHEDDPTFSPTIAPTSDPTSSPTSDPTPGSTSAPTSDPTPGPTSAPTSDPTPGPTSALTPGSTSSPTPGSTSSPTSGPTPGSTSSPTSGPTPGSTSAPTFGPTSAPTSAPDDDDIDLDECFEDL